MTFEEIEEELQRLEHPTPEFNERGTRLYLLAAQQFKDGAAVPQWLGGQWVSSFDGIPRIAESGLTAQYSLMMHLWGIASTMVQCEFPSCKDYMAHAEDMRDTFERIALLVDMQENMRVEKPSTELLH